MTHDERVYHHEMETCEGIHEHAERIAALEELVLDLYDFARDAEYATSSEWQRYRDRMAKLGVER